MKLVMLVGPAGSGKSTYCRDLSATGYNRISQDDQGKAGHMEYFNICIENGAPVVIDRMNFDKKQRNRYIEPARAAGYTIEIVVFHVPRQVCFERMMARENHPTINGITGRQVPGNESALSEFKETILEEKAKQANSALDTFFTKYERVEDTEADTVIRLGHGNISNPSAIICDLDGTLCNIDHRLHHVKHEIKKHNRWDLFNKEIPNDGLNKWCDEILTAFNSCTKNYVVLCSGRVDSSRKDTEKWLQKHCIYYENLFMRHRSDFRQDYIIKEIILDFEILTRYNVLFAIDDRKQVVDMWRRRGIVCLACAEGDF